MPFPQLRQLLVVFVLLLLRRRGLLFAEPLDDQVDLGITLLLTMVMMMMMMMMMMMTKSISASRSYDDECAMIAWQKRTHKERLNTVARRDKRG